MGRRDKGRLWFGNRDKGRLWFGKRDGRLWRKRDSGRLWCKRSQGQSILIDVLHGCLQRREGLRHLVLLAGEFILIASELLYAALGELILIASELLYAALHDGKINRHRFKLCLQFC